ncbi:U-scoloptoxin(20)-Cw1a [Bradysia coprophila]|uniref:U-scoloptoxin(20)-Cw1a n=1 Tax=Bradysia coprophila TaxID=38358 RepID=UPI00187D9AEE|nr:U-scoloptoxin(20)-Cw1a [Bradysia coprophila]
MKLKINSTFLVLAVIIFASCIILASADSAISCTSCGDECAEACGTRHFRTCCFNYLRKRSSPPLMDPKPKLWLSKSLLNKLIKLAQLEESDKILIPQPLQNYNKFSESPPDDEGQV